MAWKNDQVSDKETAKILEIAREQLSVEGDFVEFGCYRGDTSLMLADVLREFQGSSCGKPVENSVSPDAESREKRLWLYDSFEGLPEKRAEDNSSLGENFTSGELQVTKREVKTRFLKAGLKVPIIKKAWFKDLTEADLPEKISFAFLDGDFYESIRDSLNLITPKLTKNAKIVVHDYKNEALPGVEKAVNEFLQGKNFKTESHQSLLIIKI